jgi:hypothetical protein
MSKLDGLVSKLAPAKERAERFLREFEWTWTKAVLASMAITAFLLVSAVVLPSFWLYFAEQQLNWRGPTDLEGFLRELSNLELGKEGRLQIRDAIAMGLTVGPIVTLLVVAAILQNWRRRLRGAGGDVRPTGGYR